jgi:chromosome segregation ATPase
MAELAEANSARTSAEQTINQLRAELERAATLEHAHRQLQAEADQLRTRLATAGRAGAESTSRERERLTQLMAELAEATSARTSAEQTIHQLRTELRRSAGIERLHVQLQAQADELRSRLAKAERSRAGNGVSADRDRITQLVVDLAEARSARSTAEEAVEELRAELQATGPSGGTVTARSDDRVARLERELRSARAEVKRAVRAQHAAEAQLEAEASRAENARAMAQLNVDAAQVAEQQALAEARRSREELKAARQEIQRWRAEARTAMRRAPRDTGQDVPVERSDVPDEVPRPRPPRSREAAASQSRATRTAGRSPSQPSRRQHKRANQPRWLPSESMLGLVLLVLGLAIAILILSGAIKLGFAP